MPTYQYHITTFLGSKESLFTKMLLIIGGGSSRGTIYKCCGCIIPGRRGWWGILCLWSEKLNRKIMSMKATKEVPVLVRNKEWDIGASDVPDINIFQISERHTDVTAYDLSERWGISLCQATRKLKNTRQKLLRSAVLLLARGYRTDRVFTTNALQGKWLCDTMDGIWKSIDGNQCTQVFANRAKFAKF